MSQTTNGNGLVPASKRSVTPPEPLALNDAMEPPAWLKSLRDAMASSINADDLKAVMSKQVEKAKTGDTKAAAFVMDQANKMLQTDAKRSVSITQNNYYDSPRPDEPITPTDDDRTREAKLRTRARSGIPLSGLPDDRRFKPVTDEEEKELRRREDAEDAA